MWQHFRSIAKRVTLHEYGKHHILDVTWAIIFNVLTIDNW